MEELGCEPRFLDHWVHVKKWRQVESIENPDFIKKISDHNQNVNFYINGICKKPKTTFFIMELNWLFIVMFALITCSSQTLFS